MVSRHEMTSRLVVYFKLLRDFTAHHAEIPIRSKQFYCKFI